MIKLVWITLFSLILSTQTFATQNGGMGLEEPPYIAYLVAGERLIYENIFTGDVVDPDVVRPRSFQVVGNYLVFVEGDSWGDLEYINMATGERKDTGADKPINYYLSERFLFFVTDDLEYIELATGKKIDTGIENPQVVDVKDMNVALIEGDSWGDLEVLDLRTGKAHDTGTDKPSFVKMTKSHILWIESDSWADLEYMSLISKKKVDTGEDKVREVTARGHHMAFVDEDGMLKYLDMNTEDDESIELGVEGASNLVLSRKYLAFWQSNSRLAYMDLETFRMVQTEIPSPQRMSIRGEYLGFDYNGQRHFLNLVTGQINQFNMRRWRPNPQRFVPD